MPRGGFGGFRGGFGGFRGGFGGRRMGGPIIMGGGMGMGGMGGMGLGSPLLTSLLAGGVGYALGSGNAQNQNAPQGAYMSPPQYYPVPIAPPPASASGGDTGRLAQLRLLGELHDSGVLSDEEFAREKQRVLGAA